MRFVGQDYEVRRLCTFVDQTYILCFDILRNKTSLVIWFSTHCWSLANQNKSFISPQTLNILLCQSHLFLYMDAFFVSVFFKGAFDWIQGVRCNWKANMVRIFRSSHLQVVIYILNGGKLYEIRLQKAFLILLIFYFPDNSWWLRFSQTLESPPVMVISKFVNFITRD